MIADNQVISGNTILYTVPVGRYSEIFILYYESNEGTSEGLRIDYDSLSQNGQLILSAGSGVNTKQRESQPDAVLVNGDSILSATANRTYNYKIFIKEYLLP